MVIKNGDQNHYGIFNYTLLHALNISLINNVNLFLVFL